MSPNAANKERRKKSRKSPASLVYVEFGPTNGGMMRDLNEEGFALRAMMPVREGEKTPFSFSLNEKVKIEGQGQVLWIKENGRVAGVQFLEISSLGRSQIQSWLNGTLESLTTGGAEDKSPSPGTQSFAELREELRAPVPRPEPAKPHWAMKLPVAQATVSGASAAVPGARAEVMPAGTTEISAEEPSEAPMQEPPGDSTTYPGLPDFSATQDAIEITFESPAAPMSAPAASPPAKLTTWRKTPEKERVAPPSVPRLPDISAILMQPPGKEKEFASTPPTLQPLEPVSPSHGTGQESSRGRFTASRALTMMVLLAWVVGVIVYHQQAGQFLIWVGVQMGGNQENTAPVATSQDSVSTEQANPPSSNPLDSAIPAPAASSATPGVGQDTANPAAEQRNSNGQAALPEQSSPPPVTPLSGISPLAASETETGLEEYTHALQLLHGKNRDADISEAVRLLWISVEKGNPSAELTLAELYWHGQGVARNCDQARILLSAAARKGNADAQKRLQQIQREGCE